MSTTVIHIKEKEQADKEQAKKNGDMQAGVQLVLAMGYSVTVSAASLLMTTLYQRLFAGESLALAIRSARNELFNEKKRRAYYAQEIDLEDWLLPVVYQNRPVQLTLRELTPAENTAYYEQQAELTRTAPPEPTYGFVGRDLDILRIERRVLLKRTLLLVRGMGGAGKTTLLRHLGAWWRTTGLVEHVFTFGYEDRAWTRQQILFEIAQQLLDPVAYLRDFQPLSPDAQQAKLTKLLRAQRHLLILDNLESITGTSLAIPHTLDTTEQEHLRRLLADLAGGQTLVLLGSRSSEDWLAMGTFGDNVYDLPGLDAEAASTLADIILERHGATTYRQDDDFQHLLKLLNGFPLALEVVLPNLARQTPKAVLSALQVGDVTLDTGDTEDKTKSILRCIDYSHSNLSPQAQHLLLCLAPFTSILWLDVLENYTEHLQQQPALANQPFARWPEVLKEAANWGLLSPDADNPRFLHLQPTLSYFLQNRLNQHEQAEQKAAIEAAFREHYRQVGEWLDGLLTSKDSQERQIGQFITRLEYENLVTALNLALAAQTSIADFHNALVEYVDSTPNQHRGLELFQDIEKQFAAYPSDKLAGPIGIEYVSVIGTIANWQLDLKHSEEAGQSYQKVLAVVDQVNGVDEKTKSRVKGTVYHQLGMVAQEQRQWPQAEQYYQQALHIKEEYNDRYAQARTYHHLGMVAQEQRQWPQAEQYYQQALHIKEEYNDRYEQARTYHQLGMVAQKQRQWAQAEQYCQQALLIFVEYNDRYAQASTYHQLGMVAQEQRQWAQAEQYYQQALHIKVEYNDRYKQANTYGQLGLVAQEQQQWTQACDYLLHALEIFVAYEDNHNASITLYNSARLWRESGDTGVPGRVAEKVGVSVGEVEELLKQVGGICSVSPSQKKKGPKDKPEPAQQYDTTFKDWIRTVAREVLPILLPGAVYEETLDVEAIKPTMRMDKVFKAVFPERLTGKEHLIDIEFQTSYDPDLAARLLVYNAILYYENRLPVISLVIYPFKTTLIGSPLVISSGKRSLVTFDFLEIALFQEDAAYYVKEHLIGMYPVLPTMQGVDHVLMRKAMDELFEFCRGREESFAEQFVWMEVL